MNVSRPSLAGYAHLVQKYDVRVPALLHTSSLADVSARRVERLDGPLVELFPRSYDPGDSDIDHLVFALKYDGVDLAVLGRIFQHIDRTELARVVAEQPTSKYARRLFFLFEFLLGERLDVADLPRNNYVPVLDPTDYFVSRGRPSPRHRVTNNLLGEVGFCPVVRRTPALTQASRKDLGTRAREITAVVDPVLLTRATTWLYTKETRSSFAIEREEPGTKLERFLALLATIGERPLDSEAELTQLQQALVDPRYAESGFRRDGDLEVYVGETIGFRERVHHVGARSASTPTLMQAWSRMRPIEGPGGAVVEAACRSFAFVFIHPFGDGNGRIHRLLLHNTLARRNYFPPGLVVPISAILYADRPSYDRALESFSARVLPLMEYKLDHDGKLTILNDNDDLYRYPDLTAISEATYGWLERAVEIELVAEIEFLRRLDEVRARMREIVEMPDRKEQNFIKICLANRGKLSRNKRKLFAELDDATVAALEAVIADAYELDPAPSPGTPPASETS